MSILDAVRHQWRIWFQREGLAREMEEEIRFHVHLAEANEPGRRSRLGNLTLLGEERRNASGLGALDQLSQDVGYSVRRLRRSPAIAIGVVCALALGIGANTAVFSIVDALALRQLSVDSPRELVQFADAGRDAFTVADFDRLRGAMRVSSDITAMSRLFPRGSPIDEGGETSYAFVQLVAENYFDVLGAHLARGRAFHAAGDRAAVISDGYWRVHFGASDGAIGKRIRYGDAAFVVTGIAVPEFRGTSLELPTDVWLPLDAVIPTGAPGRARGRSTLIMARLRTGATTAQAAAEATAILGRHITVASGATGYSALRAKLSRPLLLVGIVVALVLLIMCANLANLMLAGTSARTRELAVRRAIGASRARVVRQLVAESLTLSALGGAAAILVAYGMHGALLRFLPLDQSPAFVNLRFSVNAQLLGFTALLAGITCVLFGLIPGVIVTSAGWATELRAGTSSASRTRAWMSRALLVTQLAMCVLMLSVAGVFLRSVHNLRFQSTGYREDGLLVADVEFPRAYDETQRKAFVRALVAHVARLPAVIEVGFSNIGQLSGRSVEFPVRGLGGSTVDSASALRVSPRFFAAMGTVVVAGRDFAPSDEDRATPVAIVNEAFARQVLARGNAIGQRFVQEVGPQPHMPIEVVGVVEDVKWHDLRERATPMFYQPYWQDGDVAGVRLALRSSGDYGLLATALTRDAGKIDRRVVLRNVAPFSVVIDGVLTTERLVSETATVLGVLALLLAAIGLFSVLAYQVNQRRREIAVRIVLGAEPGAVEAKVLGESMVLLVIGCLIGIPASVLATRLGASLLFGVRSNDPVTIVVVVGVLAVTVALAAYVPAKRAASTDPALALRD